MMHEFSNVFALFGNCEWVEAGVNYSFWIYTQHQATMREVRHEICMILEVLSIVKFILINVKNCSKSIQAVEITP